MRSAFGKAALLLGAGAALWASRGAAFAQTAEQGSSSRPLAAEVARERPPALDPAGPAISLVSDEPLFLMASALNACGYDEGLAASDPLRLRVREAMNRALAESEAGRAARDRICLYFAQHRVAGAGRDAAQYISLSLYLSEPPELELTAPLAEMPPEAAQAAEVAPLLREFAARLELHTLWVTLRPGYERLLEALHGPLSAMIVATNAYLKTPAAGYEGRRFLVIVEPMLAPGQSNARVYGPDYIVVASPGGGALPMEEVRHVYLHFVIDPLLLSRARALDRVQPVLRELRAAPLPYLFRTDATALGIECLIQAIEARRMQTGVAPGPAFSGAGRSEQLREGRERQAAEARAEAMRQERVRRDVAQGYVLVPYFYRELQGFERDPASLKDAIGAMAYSMDVAHEAAEARRVVFEKTGEEDVLRRSSARRLEGLDLAEERLSAGDVARARELAQAALRSGDGATQARANFLLARVAALGGAAQEAAERFRQMIASARDPRLLAWSHIYLGRMLDLECRREEALAEYRLAEAHRDGQQDTRLAAERGLREPYAVAGHGCAAEGRP